VASKQQPRLAQTLSLLDKKSVTFKHYLNRHLNPKQTVPPKSSNKKSENMGQTQKCTKTQNFLRHKIKTGTRKLIQLTTACKELI
jgi:hypothetical protein